MTVPGAAQSNGSGRVTPIPSAGATRRRGGPEAEAEQKTASSADSINVSASARALAQVMLNDEPTLQLSAQQLRAMSTPDSSD